MIEINQLQVKRGKRTILQQLNFQLLPGQVTTVLGKNGAGKSTLLETITGRLPFAAGQIHWDGVAFPKISTVEMAFRRAVLSQQVEMNFPIKVAELVEMGMYARFDQLSRKQRKLILGQTMEQFDLQPFFHRYFHQLSGGERQRVLMAKCLTQLACSRDLCPNQYLFLDEPTNSLDIEQQYRLLAQVRELAHNQQLGVLAILHDINLAAQCSDNVLLLKDGRIRYQGSPEEALTEKSLRDVFNIHATVGRHPVLDRPLITILPYEVYNHSQTTTGGTQSATA